MPGAFPATKLWCRIPTWPVRAEPLGRRCGTNWNRLLRNRMPCLVEWDAKTHCGRHDIGEFAAACRVREVVDWWAGRQLG